MAPVSKNSTKTPLVHVWDGEKPGTKKISVESLTRSPYRFTKPSTKPLTKPETPFSKREFIRRGDESLATTHGQTELKEKIREIFDEEEENRARKNGKMEQYEGSHESERYDVRPPRRHSWSDDGYSEGSRHHLDKPTGRRPRSGSSGFESGGSAALDDTRESIKFIDNFSATEAKKLIQPADPRYGRQHDDDLYLNRISGYPDQIPEHSYGGAAHPNQIGDYEFQTGPDAFRLHGNLKKKKSTSTTQTTPTTFRTSYASREDPYPLSESPWEFQSLQLDQTQPQQAWILLPGKNQGNARNGNFRAQPISLTASIGSRLKHSFTNIGALRSTNETPIQAIDARLIEEDEEDEDKRKRKRNSATKWGAGVAAGSTMFAALLIGGTFIATNGGGSSTNGTTNSAGFGFFGNGQGNVNGDTGPCTEYKILSDSWRKIINNGPQNTGGAYHCDKTRAGSRGLTEGWYRFMGAAGTYIPETPQAPEVCGTSIVAYVNGPHPKVHEGVVERQFCFQWNTGTCQYKVRSQIRTCNDPDEGGTFYVYYLRTPPDIGCFFAYCATDI